MNEPSRWAALPPYAGRPALGKRLLSTVPGAESAGYAARQESDVLVYRLTEAEIGIAAKRKILRENAIRVLGLRSLLP